MFQHRYDCVHKPAKSGSHFYFSAFESDHHITGFSQYHSHFAFDSAEPSEKREQPASFIPKSPPMERQDPGDRYFSSCQLDGVVEVVPCRSRPGRQYKEGGVVTGLLVRYGSGDRACVGAFRFDWAVSDASVATGRTGKLCIGYGREPTTVVDIRGELPLLEDGLLWVEIPLTGRLEWWSFRDQVEIHHVANDVTG